MTAARKLQVCDLYCGAGGAEAEIRLILDQIMTISKARWPNVFADFERVDDGWVTKNSKV